MKTYQEFLLFASRRLKLKFEVIEFIVRGFLQKFHLRPRTIECYLIWGQKNKTHSEIAKMVGTSQSTVTRELQKLEFICPELFIQGFYVPDIPWMYHPTKEKWEELERMEIIKEKF